MLFADRDSSLAGATNRRCAWYREEVFLDFDPVIDTEADPFEETADPEGQPPPDGPP